MGISWLQIAIVAVLVILLFGRGKIASLMGELAQGIKSFRKGLDTKGEKNESLLDQDDSKEEEENK